jgi:hypothetical protein
MAEVIETGVGTYEVLGVTEEEVFHARETFASGISGIEADSGSAEGESTKLDYEWDHGANVVRITVHSFPSDLQDLPPETASKALLGVLARGFEVPAGAAAGVADKVKPNRYGVYNYVVPLLTNNTRLDLNFSSQTMGNGTLYSFSSSVAAGASTSNLFEADSTKLSGTGVGGTVYYQLTDGTPLRIDFFLNTIWTHSLTAAFTGANAGKYKAVEVTDTDPSLDGYTYLNPTITIAGLS